MHSSWFILLLAAAAVTAPKVTAKITDLYPSKACKTKIKGGEGQDPVLRCPSAIKGYEVEVGFSAIDTHVTVRGDGKETSFSGLVGKKLEWRLIDGKPIALIVELADHDDENPGKQVKPRVVVLPWGSSKAHLEVPLPSSPPDEINKVWDKARAAADTLAK